jgi:hypothetical protein
MNNGNRQEEATDRGEEEKARLQTLKPIVGIVVTISPSFNLYRMVVLPAASRPTIKILLSFLLEKSLFKSPPMFVYKCIEIG